MKKTSLASCSMIAIVGAIYSGGAIAQEAPPGASASGCAVNSFEAIRSEKTGDLLYWNNPTCPAGPGATDGSSTSAPILAGYGV